jgi:hypothetical protein
MLCVRCVVLGWRREIRYGVRAGRGHDVAVTRNEGAAGEQRLYDAVVRWNPDTGYGLTDLIYAACQALIDGLDSPTLRELAGASPRDSSWDVRELVGKTLDELGIPQPGTVPVGCIVAAGGGVARRTEIDSLRLAVVPAPDTAGGGFQMEVYVNDKEMTSAGAGIGMEPYDLLIPTNRLLATPQPQTVPIARCECGVYGCGSTDVTITRDDDLVHWDWSLEVPMNRGVSFTARQYDAEVVRVAGDHSWETAERAAGRLVLTHLDREALLAHGLMVTWAANDYRDPELFQVALQMADDYQIFVDTPWRGRSPAELAHEVCETLARGPGTWRASWHAIKPTLTEPPAIATRSWQRYQYR